MSEDIKVGFAPFMNADSKLLILGSFPSVKSRDTGFYYGNPRNAFWKTLANFFGDKIPSTIKEKQDFLTKRKIALWDVVILCEIHASDDSSIKNFTVADVKWLISVCPIQKIILNGGKAYEIFVKNFSDIGIPYKKLCSTSPANTRFNYKEWYDELSATFNSTQSTC